MPGNFNWSRCYDAKQMIPPNGDISGPGVLGSFFGTGWLVTILVIGYYFVGFDPNAQFKDANDPGEPLANLDSETLTEGPDTPSLHPNPIDEIMLALIHVFIRPLRRLVQPILPLGRFGSRQNVLKGLEKCILALCDLQIITGLSIMMSGYILLAQGSLSAYSWQIIIYLAWFSNLTHQAALMFLRGYLWKHPQQRTWRFCLMTILVVMMIIALIPTAFFDWNEPQCNQPGSEESCRSKCVNSGYYGNSNSDCIHNCLENSPLQAAMCQNCSSAAYPAAPAICFYDLNMLRELSAYPPACLGELERGRKGPVSKITFQNSTALQSATISITVLASSYALRAIKSFETPSSFLHYRVRALLARVCRNVVATLLMWEPPCRWLGGPLWSLLVLRPVLALYLLGRILVDFFLSTFADVWWLLISAVVGTIRLFKATGRDKEEETLWTFGQIMSIFLLISPILMLLQTLLGHVPSNTAPGSGQSAQISSQAVHEEDTELGFEVPEIGSLDGAPKIHQPRQTHSYTTQHLDFKEEISQLFKRDYYNEYVWVVAAVGSVAIIPMLVLSLLTIALIRDHSLASVAMGSVLPIAACSGGLLFTVTLGLAIEGWKYEYHAAGISVCLVYGGAIISLLGPAGLFNTFGFVDENKPFTPWFVGAVLATGYGPMFVYLTLCTLTHLVTGHCVKGFEKTY